MSDLIKPPQVGDSVKAYCAEGIAPDEGVRAEIIGAIEGDLIGKVNDSRSHFNGYSVRIQPIMRDAIFYYFTSPFKEVK